MNVVPYIDVMLVLLVIFMVTAPMMQAGIEINSPQGVTPLLDADNQREPLTIYVDQSGYYWANDGRALSIEGMEAYIQAELGDNQQRPVYIKGDAQVPYQYLYSAMLAVQRAGATTIGLLGEPNSVNSNR